jgi:hypothetical protein
MLFSRRVPPVPLIQSSNRSVAAPVAVLPAGAVPPDVTALPGVAALPSVAVLAAVT